VKRDSSPIMRSIVPFSPRHASAVEEVGQIIPPCSGSFALMAPYFTVILSAVQVEQSPL
jgi:hypothetical protein